MGCDYGMFVEFPRSWDIAKEEFGKVQAKLEKAAGSALWLEDPPLVGSWLTIAPPGWRSADVACCRLSVLEGCHAVVVSSNATVNEAFRRRGIGQLMQNMRINIARRSGFSLMLATVVVGNTAQERIMDINGWRQRERYRNSAGPEVGLWTLRLNP